MGTLRIGSLLVQEISDSHLDHIRGTINEILKSAPGSWLMIRGAHGTDVIWISPAIPMLLAYDGAPSTTADVEFIEVNHP